MVPGSQHGCRVLAVVVLMCVTSHLHPPCVMYASDRLRDGTCCTVFTSSVPWLVPTPKTWRASIFIGHNRLLSPKSHSHTLLLRLSPLCCLVLSVVVICRRSRWAGDDGMAVSRIVS